MSTLIVVLVAVASILAFFVLPGLLIRSDAARTDHELLNARNDARSIGAQILSGALLLGGLIFTSRTVQLNADALKLSREDQTTDKFIRTFELLGNDNVYVRAGAVNALARIADNDKDSRRPIMEILSEFLRNNNHFDPSRTGRIDLPPPADIQAIVAMLVDHKYSDSLDLTEVNLQSINLSGANLRKVKLRGANLAYANLQRANLECADLRGADFSSATMG